MEIKLRTIYSGPLGSFQPGETINISEKDAKPLLDGGYAVVNKPIIPVIEPELPDLPDYSGVKKGKLREMCLDRDLDLQDGASKNDMIELLELDDMTK